MDKYQETFDTWNKVATLYQDKFMDLDLYNESYNFICNSIGAKNAKLLEIGCGPGNITKYLLAKRPDFDILGIDIAPNMVQLAKQNNPAANFAVMDSRQISKLENTYDGIICGFCLPYLSHTDVIKLIADSYNLLNSNGLLYLSFVEGHPNRSGYQTSSSGNRIYFYFHDLTELTQQLTVHKFQDIQVFNVKFKKSETETETHTILTATRS
ncbi:class I SAM-dependent methyltransferase [Pedobacter montanisoli]|uniref:Methyltransferase domain-containing protein n=1 Tax=Pedobacter montanisoli TaxID=2923277 RepID=A0ABT0A041_9SPHI|nr:class I SAM-dependent methyltransferase [Pedobacter montanisoli]MCJ0743911.1 methyltransferase domain-containing protein [Pedobacter montanisoli]